MKKNILLFLLITGISSAFLIKAYQAEGRRYKYRDYQFDIHDDTIFLYQGTRYVSTIIGDTLSKLDSVIMNDDFNN